MEFTININTNIKGFTLVELMITLAVIGILYAVAMPSYTHYVQDARRADMQQTLLQNVAYLERYYTRVGNYPATSADLITTDYYTIDSTITDTTFDLVASPTGGQEGDECGDLSIDEQGEKLPDQDGCWGK